MSITLLNIYNEPAFSYTTTLGGVGVTLKFEYNIRTKFYHVTIILRDGVEVLSEKKLLPKTFLFNSYMKEVGITGALLLAPKSDKIDLTNITPDNFADNFLLSYFF